MIIAATTVSNILLPIVYCLTLGAVAIVFLFVNDRIFHRRPSKKEMATVSKRFEERLLKPDIEGLEKHFGHALPQDLKTLYSNREEILKENIQAVGADAAGGKRVWDVAFYQPADLENVRDAWPDTKEVFEFANDGCGNGYTIDPKLENPPVMFYDHETGEWEKVANSFSQFAAMMCRQTKQ